MTQWTDLMVDLESAGLPPDGAIISVGACFFNLDTCEIGPTFKRNINLATAVRDGGTMNPGTWMWWMAQGDEARKSVLYDTYDIRQVLKEFSEFIEQHSRRQDVRVYGNGADFDVTLLNGAYLRAGMTVPWSPFRVRCFRTIRNLYPSVVYDTDAKGTSAHDALSDAIFQAKHLFAIKNRNKTNETAK